jgi:hypothetical protein
MMQTTPIVAEKARIQKKLYHFFLSKKIVSLLPMKYSILERVPVPGTYRYPIFLWYSLGTHR